MIVAEILGPDMLVIFVVVVLLFGSSQLPKLARSIGSAKREFEHGLGGGSEDEAGGAPAESASGRPTMTKSEVEAMLQDGRRERGANGHGGH